jgi:hypothetical protein
VAAVPSQEGSRSLLNTGARLQGELHVKAQQIKGHAKMDVKEAVATAKKYVGELFTQEGITNLGLEEIEFDEQAGEWRVTVGFSRPGIRWEGLLRSPKESTHDGHIRLSASLTKQELSFQSKIAT